MNMSLRSSLLQSGAVALRGRASKMFDRHGILLGGILIFAYYLWSTLDWFKTSHLQRSFEEYFFQFDSVIMLWLLLFVGSKLHAHRKAERERGRRAILENERQTMRLELLDEVTTLLTDSVNNPLAIISLSASSIRERFGSDAEIIQTLDRIEGALKNLRDLLADFHRYQTKKILKTSAIVSPVST